jgi:hypothetical protein
MSLLNFFLLQLVCDDFCLENLDFIAGFLACAAVLPKAGVETLTISIRYIRVSKISEL